MKPQEDRKVQKHMSQAIYQCTQAARPTTGASGPLEELRRRVFLWRVWAGELAPITAKHSHNPRLSKLAP